MDDFDAPPMKISIVDLAHQIIEMHEENMYLRAEVNRLSEYKQKYDNEVDASLRHSQVMIGHVLSGLINPDSAINKGFTAIAKEKQSKEGAA